MPYPQQSFTGFVLGDLVAQSPAISQGKPWDARRTAKMAAFGLCLHGPIGHYWYGFLDRSIMVSAPTSAAAVFSKTAIDQILWAPIFTSVFFGSMKVMDGKTDEIVGEVSDKLWPTMKVNCTILTCFFSLFHRFCPGNSRFILPTLLTLNL
jgi:protein Mpv17